MTLAKSLQLSILNLIIYKIKWWASLVVQWLRIHLPTQGTRVRALVREDPTCRGATKRVRHNYWACALLPQTQGIRVSGGGDGDVVDITSVPSSVVTSLYGAGLYQGRSLSELEILLMPQPEDHCWEVCWRWWVEIWIRVPFICWPFICMEGTSA